jgi:hypothetical protein
MHPWFALPFEVKNDFFYFKAYKFFEGFPQTATNWIKSAQIEYLGIVTNVNTPPLPPPKVHLVEG